MSHSGRGELCRFFFLSRIFFSSIFFFFSFTLGHGSETRGFIRIEDLSACLLNNSLSRLRWCCMGIPETISFANQAYLGGSSPNPKHQERLNNQPKTYPSSSSSFSKGQFVRPVPGNQHTLLSQVCLRQQQHTNPLSLSPVRSCHARQNFSSFFCFFSLVVTSKSIFLFSFRRQFTRDPAQHTAYLG